MPLIQGLSTSALGRPFGLAGRQSNSRARSSNGPPLVSPMKATPVFAGMRFALVKSIPAPPRLAERSEWISSAGSPSTRVSGLDPLPAPEKQTRDGRTAAPSITHGSSARESKLARPSVAVRKADRTGWLDMATAVAGLP